MIYTSLFLIAGFLPASGPSGDAAGLLRILTFIFSFIQPELQTASIQAMSLPALTTPFLEGQIFDSLVAQDMPAGGLLFADASAHKYR
jgi:hypothetical protein